MSDPRNATSPGSSYRRKYRRRSGFYKSLLVSLATGLLAIAIAYIAEHRPLPTASPSRESNQLDTQAVEHGQRKIYPYSIIPGGVNSAEELASKLATDLTAARHYKGFRVDGAVLVYARFNTESAFASYRSGNRVFWTRYRVRVEPTELLLTDGTNFVRTRCGNRLSDTPQQPTSDGEPSEEALLYTPPPISNKLIRLPDDLEVPPLLSVQAAYDFPSVGTIASPEPVNKVGPLVAVVQSRGPRPAPVTNNAPEPGSIALLTSGVLGIFLLSRFRKKCGLYQGKEVLAESARSLD